ncbi:hypothetical protein ACWEN6_28865 [Sphaerisporangium sp. NPDC004334]
MSRRSGAVKWSLCALGLTLLAQGQPASAAANEPVRPAGGTAAATGTTANRAADFTVFAFSQSDVEQEDPQVYKLVPDVNIRAIGK